MTTFGEISWEDDVPGDKKENTKDNIRLNFFTNRVANDWNVLPKEAVEAKSVNSFKARIDKVYEKNGTYKTLKRTRQIVKENKTKNFIDDNLMSNLVCNQRQKIWMQMQNPYRNVIV